MTDQNDIERMKKKSLLASYYNQDSSSSSLKEQNNDDNTSDFIYSPRQNENKQQQQLQLHNKDPYDVNSTTFEPDLYLKMLIKVKKKKENKSIQNQN
jgi:hypothetical protein